MHAIERAVSAFESGDFFAALGYVERACRIAPPQPEHSLLRAAVLENVGYPDLARDAYRAALLHGLYNPLVRREAFRRLKPLLAADELKALADEFLALEPDECLIDDLIALGPEFRAETVGWLWRKDGDIAITLLSRQPADITIDLTIDGANARFDIPVRIRSSHRAPSTSEAPRSSLCRERPAGSPSQLAIRRFIGFALRSMFPGMPAGKRPSR